jgi:prepilin-type N-terminal cleavage/methylation domain-containing protein
MAFRSPSTSRAAGPVRGFTLTESLIASVLLAVTVVGLCGVLAATQQNAAAGEELATGHMLARQLMEEIGSKPFGDPSDGSLVLGPEPDETSRALFDNTDDYHGYRDSTGALVMADGTVVPLDGGEFIREVTVQYRTSPSGPNAMVGDFAVVTVSVTTPTGYTATLQQLFTNVELRR